MSRLQEFVGTREYPPKPPVSASGFVMHPSSKNERMKAIIQGLASSTEPQKSKSVYGSQDDVFPGLQPSKDENNGISSPVLEVPDIPPGSLITNTRWHGFRPVVRASHSVQDSLSQDADPIEELSAGHDIFGTDIENLDSTVASSDVALSDFGDVQSRHEQGEAGIGVFNSPNQRLRTAQFRKVMFLNREHQDNRNDEYVISSDREDYLHDKAGKDHQIVIDEKSIDQRLDEPDRLARTFHPRMLEGNPGLSLQSSPRATNFRGNSTPHITTSTTKLISGRDSMEPSASMIDSGLTHRRKMPFHTSNGEFSAGSLDASEPGRKEVKKSESDRYSHVPRGSSEAELSRMNSRLRQDKSNIIKDGPVNFYQGGSSFISRSENFKRAEDLDPSSTHFGGMIDEQQSEESFEQNLEMKTIKNLQTVAYTELSKTLLELYNTRDNTNAHSQQEAFFSALDITQSERCGDFFIERFVDVMAKYNTIRRQRRDIATTLESEIARREVLVGMRREVVDRSLDELRQAGKGVVRGKSSIVSSE